MNIGAGCHPNKVKVSGPGVAKSGLKAFEPTYFTVDCSEAGQGEQHQRLLLFSLHSSAQTSGTSPLLSTSVFSMEKHYPLNFLSLLEGACTSHRARR